MPDIPTHRLLRKRLFKYRLKEQYRRKFHLAFIGITSILLIAILYGPVFRSIDKILHPKSYGVVRVDNYKDYNALHLRYARHNGVKPFSSDRALQSGIDDLTENNRLVRITSNKYYKVKELSHSHPYLTPKASKLLTDIGKRYQKNLNEANMGSYAYQISSLLRTKESQKRLKGVNRNATPNTTSHLYGTTFDIAYRQVIKRRFFLPNVEVEDAKAIKILSKTIGELRHEGRCVVVTEKYEKCFHITVKN